ncbi:hypothetical protein J437_LFUL017874 [Ladona fulva]|uniref:G-protein coupled receptor Mth2 n=1 Tax=Ladona fulva TaxID=123851 RepID=A0A8K0KLR7_LADFU|nr:hypothetical protein J437_LFUL017874 [Ladona fulva]
MLDPFTHDIDEFYIKKTDGYLVVPFENFTEQGPEDFCIDYFPEKDAHLPLLCFPPNDDDLTNQLIYTMYPVGMLVSIPFLLVTFLVYALIPELRNLHGKSLMCHVSSLLMAYTFLAVVQLGGTSLNDATCIASAIDKYL